MRRGVSWPPVEGVSMLRASRGVSKVLAHKRGAVEGVLVRNAAVSKDLWACACVEVSVLVSRALAHRGLCRSI